jgi:hypothetical protein
MAVSTCIKSGEHGFELVLFTPLGGSHISRWFSFARSSRFRWRLLAFALAFRSLRSGHGRTSAAMKAFRDAMARTASWPPD